MTGQFSHLKKTKDNFIQAAEKVERNTRAKQKHNKEDILLVVSGKMDRDDCGKPVLIHLKTDIASDMEKHCQGNKQAIFNYLLRLGINTLKKNGELILEVEQ